MSNSWFRWRTHELPKKCLLKWFDYFIPDHRNLGRIKTRNSLCVHAELLVIITRFACKKSLCDVLVHVGNMRLQTKRCQLVGMIDTWLRICNNSRREHVRRLALWCGTYTLFEIYLCLGRQNATDAFANMTGNCFCLTRELVSCRSACHDVSSLSLPSYVSSCQTFHRFEYMA